MFMLLSCHYINVHAFVDMSDSDELSCFIGQV